MTELQCSTPGCVRKPRDNHKSGPCGACYGRIRRGIPAHAFTRTCADCGGEFEVAGTVAKRCPDCRESSRAYITVRLGKGHPHANVRGWAYEHRWVMGQALGRPLFPEETVHHRNGDRSDNRIENLELWTSHHQRGQRVSDLVDFVVTRYPDLVEDALRGLLDQPKAA